MVVSGTLVGVICYVSMVPVGVVKIVASFARRLRTLSDELDVMNSTC